MLRRTGSVPSEIAICGSAVVMAVESICCMMIAEATISARTLGFDFLDGRSAGMSGREYLGREAKGQPSGAGPETEAVARAASQHRRQYAVRRLVAVHESLDVDD